MNIHFLKQGLWRLLQLLLFCTLLGVLNRSAQGQDVSLHADDSDDVRVQVDGRPLTVTVMRAAHSPNQWYYVPRAPRLSEVAKEGQREPIFHLYRYQFETPGAAQKLTEGGLLQFSCNFALAEEALDQIKSYLSQKTGTAKPQISLTALRIKTAQVHVYVPEIPGQGNQGVFLAAPVDGNGIAPLYASQEMAFSIPLTKAGTALYNAISEGNDGVKMQVLFTYGGLTPPAGFKVVVDYRQAYEHYSRADRFRAEASYYGLFGASYEQQSQFIRDELIKSGAMTIDIQEGSGFKLEDIDKYLQPIVKRINDEVMEAMKPPAKVDPAVAPGKDKGGYFGSVNYSASVKDVRQVRQIKETIDFKFRHYEERTTVAAGFISVGGYPKTVRDRLFTVVPGLNWESAYFLLPTVGDKPELGIESVVLTVGVNAGEKRVPDKTAVWTPREGWKRRDERVSALDFALLEQGISGELLKQAIYATRMTITARGETLELVQTKPAFDGERAITTPFSGVDVIEIDGSDLSWRKLDANSALDRVLITLKSGNREVRYTLKPRSINGQFALPEPFYWLVPRTEREQPEPIDVRVQFEMNDGRLIEWTGNGNLRQRYPGLSVALKDAMWRP